MTYFLFFSSINIWRVYLLLTHIDRLSTRTFHHNELYFISQLCNCVLVLTRTARPLRPPFKIELRNPIFLWLIGLGCARGRLNETRDENRIAKNDVCAQPTTIVHNTRLVALATLKTGYLMGNISFPCTRALIMPRLTNHLWLNFENKFLEGARKFISSFFSCFVYV